MSSSFEKSVKGGTKVKLAPPKSKYVEHILLATQSGEAGVAEVFRTLIHRLRDATWTVVFKSLIIVHLMIKEGAPEVTLRYLAVAPRNRLAINHFTDVQTQGSNIRHYSEYLLSRASAFASSKCDHARDGDARIKKLSVDKGLLRETELVQEQVKALIKCDLLSSEPENEISLTAFRLLTRDLLDLYNVENVAVMNVLSHYFEMSKPDAERAIKIYKVFCKQTEHVVQYLGVARQFEHATRLEIPKLKHAPTTGLVHSLQEYLDDGDFDINRRQYLAEKEARKTGKPVSKSSTSGAKDVTGPPNAAPASSAPQLPSISTANTNTNSKGPAPDLIDFFESIESNQQPLGQNAAPFQQQQTGFPTQAQIPQLQTQGQPQMAGFAPVQQQTLLPYQMAAQQTDMQPFPPTNGATGAFGQLPQPAPLQSQFTGAGFGGYGPQPPGQTYMPGNAFAQQQHQQQQQQYQQPSPVSPLQAQPTSSNPFRQSMMPTGGGFGLPQRQSTNPFAKDTPNPQFPTQNPQPLQPQMTGSTNPFAKPVPQQAAPPLLQVQPTGMTNPFRQSQFINQQTGQGWQNAPQGTMGGLENLDTIPIFPRPGQLQPQTHQQQSSPWQ